MKQILDVYSGNRIDIEKELNTGTDGIIFKAAQGEWLDVPRVKPEWIEQCKALGMPYGFYWLVDARYSPERHKAAMAKAFPTPESVGQLGMWLDCEKPMLAMPEMVYKKLPYAFYKPIESIAQFCIKQYGRVGIYTSPGQWNLVKGRIPESVETWFATLPLWQAQYKVKSPSKCGKWLRYFLWQYMEQPDYSVPFDDAEFDAYCKLNSTPEPEVEICPTCKRPL